MKVDVSLDEVERHWRDFAARASSNGGEPVHADESNDPGTVYFTKAGDGRTEVTIQVDPDYLQPDDEATLNRRVASYLERFKDFAEARS